VVHSPIRGSSLVRGSSFGIVVAPLVVRARTAPGRGSHRLQVGGNLVLMTERVLERAGYRREGVVRSMPVPRGARSDKTLFSPLPGEGPKEVER